jgi:pyruvate/2-oxoglutarate dehydrogenase complex dihydrolipoamide acyltransferase (E2) component
MATDLKIPALGEGVESGDVLEIFVSEGDVIKKDDGLLELETDKATVTVPASEGGKITKIHVSNGDTIKVGQVVVTIEAAAGSAPAKPAAPAPVAEKPAPAANPAPSKAPPLRNQKVPASPEIPAVPTQPTLEERPALSPLPTLSESGAIVSSGAANIAAGPAMRRFARELGVDLATVQGSGANGRIVREDILQVVRSGSSRSNASSTAVKGSSSAPGSATTGSSDAHGSVRIEKMPRIRQTIAQKMHESWSTVPRVTNFDDADVTDLDLIRQNNKKDYEARNIKLTTMPFLIKAVAMALKSHPIINASVDMQNGQIIYKDYINVGIAIDSERGLVVPALRGVDKLGIPDVARALSEMAEKVRAGNFGVEDLRGGTFTISNLGAIGGTYSTPIINVPETAILLVGRSRKMPVVVGEEVKIRLMMPLSLSYDHRLIDGAAAARFLNDVIGYLEAPSRLLLAL